MSNPLQQDQEELIKQEAFIADMREKSPVVNAIFELFYKESSDGKFLTLTKSRLLNNEIYDFLVYLEPKLSQLNAKPDFRSSLVWELQYLYMEMNHLNTINNYKKALDKIKAILDFHIPTIS